MARSGMCPSAHVGSTMARALACSTVGHGSYAVDDTTAGYVALA